MSPNMRNVTTSERSVDVRKAAERLKTALAVATPNLSSQDPDEMEYLTQRMDRMAMYLEQVKKRPLRK